MHSGFRYGLLATAFLSCVLVCKLYAGGSGLNTVVIVNQNSSNSCTLANYYCQYRQVPPENVLRINWAGGNTLWTSNDFQTNLVTPLSAMLTSRGLTNQAYYVVLSMDIPFQTTFGSTTNSTTSALFYGIRSGTPSDTNSYAASEAAFSPATPVVGAPGYSFLATMITANSLPQAEQLVNQGVASDGTFPQSPVVLAKSSDPIRNIRYAYPSGFDNAIFNVNILEVSSILSTNTDSVWWPNGCLGYETGLAQFSVPPGMFVPGAIADSLTSFGGIIFGPNSQTNLLAFINAGATGSYGTVAEPNADTQRFPNPQAYFYQARGFSLAESYYQSVNVPYLGLIVAEPLAAPFAVAGYGEWSTNLPPGTVLNGTAPLSVGFFARDATHPLQQVDLFVDGKYFETLTNLVPATGNLLTVTLNGYPISYTVPTNSTLGAVASGLAALINASTNATQVRALVHGDRVELQSVATNLMTVPFYVADTTPTNTPGLSYNVNYLPNSFPPQMTPLGLDKNGAFTMEVGIPSPMPYVILASTNLANWRPVFTNAVPPGLLDFTDEDSTNYPARFYRMTWPVADQPPTVSAPAIVAPGTFQMHVDSTPGLPWAVQISSNLMNWTSVFTNQLGGAMVFGDGGITNAARRFYRVWLLPPGSPGYTVFSMATNLSLVRVDNAVRPYTVAVSTNQGQGTILETNFALGEILTTAASGVGSGSGLSTFLQASQSRLLASEAFGFQMYSEKSNSIPASSWMQFTFIKTNGQAVVVAVTNQSPSDSLTLASQLYNAINTNPALQGSDGVMAGAYAINKYGTFLYTGFNLYARSPGYTAATIQVISTNSSQVPWFTPLVSTLTYNVSDLQPRNHLYVTAGAFSLNLTFNLDTTSLADGYHSLTAVAYEGSDTRTQTPVTVPVQIQNTSLSATMTFLDLTNQAPVQGTYHIRVAANTNTVNLITLFSTGGVLSTATNVSTATFQVNGTNLWAGLHPFYATVVTTNGLGYRTQTQWVQLKP